ncbi:MAG: Bcr/CflA family efflux MFS transporter [Gammaproteobacteria bacterium]|nr:MAG: Bcr/CflA family efflux MFS transporter [Gammaproteobacteria bacterium]
MKNDAVLSYKISIIIFILSVCSALFSDLYVSSLPIIASYFKCSINLSQGTVTCFLCGFALGQYIYGSLSDRYGRRKIIMIALLIASFSSIVCADSATIYTLLAGRFCQGIGVAACLSLPRAILRDIYSGEQMAKISSSVSASVELVITFAPAIGGYLTYYGGWRGNFYFLFVFAFLALCIVYCHLPETNKEFNVEATNVQRIKKNYQRMLANRKFLGYAICSSVGYSLLMIYFSISPFILQNNLHFSVNEYGLILLLTSLMLVFGAFLSSYFVSRFNINLVILAGVTCITLAGIFMLIGFFQFSINVYLIIIPSMLSIIGAGLLFSNCSAGALHEFADIAGTASSFYSGLQIAGAFIITYFISSIGLKSVLALAIIYLILGIISYLAYYFLIYVAATRSFCFQIKLDTD